MQTISKKEFPKIKRQRPHTYWCALKVSFALALLAGCQTYRPDPLDLPAYADKWQKQRASSEKVHAFAKRLAETTSDTKEFDPTNGFSLAEGEVVALVFNPDLRIARLQAGVAKANAKYAGLWDDPKLSIDVLKITEGVPDPWVVGSALSITIPISGRLRVEKARAEAAMHAELERVAEAEWKVRRDLREGWLSWSAQRLRLQQTEEIITVLDSIIESTTRLAEEGELLTTEAALFSIERESRRVEIGRLEGEVAESKQRLHSLLGLSPTAPANLIPTLSAVPNPSDKETPDESNPTLSRLHGEYAVAERTLLREIRKQYPDVTIGPQGESDQGQSRIGFIGAIPIPILNSNKGGIAKARADREIARAAFETEYERIVGGLAVLYSRLQGVRSRRKTINETLVPLVDRQVEDAGRLLKLGEGGSLVLLASLVRAHEARLQLIDIQLEDARTNKEIRYLIGPEATGKTRKKHITP